MSAIDVDELVNGWLLSKWLEDSRVQIGFPGDDDYYGPDPKLYSPELHGPVESLRVLSADGDWVCGCYSEYTRDDSFIMTALIHTAAGEVEYSYGRWCDFPRFIEELEEYRVNTTCYHEDAGDD